MLPRVRACSTSLLATTLVLLSVPFGVSCGPKEAASALEAKSSWCPDHYEQGPGDTCFALPARKHDAKLLVYLHGAEDPAGAKQEFAVVSAALDKGYAVVLAHGKRGACGFSTNVKDGNCWPLDDEKEMGALVDDWEQALWQVTALLEGESHPRFVLAFREGAEFALRLASKSMLNTGPNPPRNLRVDGLALVGLRPTAQAVPHVPGQLPLAVLDEEASPNIALKDELVRAKWPHARCTRSAAALSSADVDMASAVLAELTPPVPAPTVLPKGGAKKGKKPHAPTEGPGKKVEPPKALRTAGCVVE